VLNYVIKQVSLPINNIQVKTWTHLQLTDSLITAKEFVCKHNIQCYVCLQSANT